MDNVVSGVGNLVVGVPPVTPMARVYYIYIYIL